MVFLIACPLGFLGVVFLFVGMATHTPAMTGVKATGRAWLGLGATLLVAAVVLGTAGYIAALPDGW